MTAPPTCTICRDRGTVTVFDFDGQEVVPCPACQERDRHERARAALAREYGTERQRWSLRRRVPMRAPR